MFNKKRFSTRAMLWISIIIVSIGIIAYVVPSVVFLPDMSVLERFNTPESLENLIRYLSSDKKWEVVRTDKHVFARQRLGSSVTILISDKYSVYYYASEWAIDEPTVATPQDRMIRVKLTKDGDEWCSDLYIGEKQLTVRIQDCGATRNRAETRTALRELASELAIVLQWIEKGGKAEQLADILSPGSVKYEGRHVFQMLEDGFRDGVEVYGDGLYEVYGYVNFGERGHIYIRTFYDDTGEEIAAGRHAVQTREYVGWSDEPAEKYFYGSEISMYGDGSYRDVRVELWFSGSEERLLSTQVMNLQTWTH